MRKYMPVFLIGFSTYILTNFVILTDVFVNTASSDDLIDDIKIIVLMMLGALFMGDAVTSTIKCKTKKKSNIIVVSIISNVLFLFLPMLYILHRLKIIQLKALPIITESITYKTFDIGSIVVFIMLAVAIYFIRENLKKN